MKSLFAGRDIDRVAHGLAGQTALLLVGEARSTDPRQFDNHAVCKQSCVVYIDNVHL